MATSHPVNGGVFKAAMKMGFSFTEHKRLGSGRDPISVTKKYVEDHILACKPRWSRCYEMVIHLEPYGGKIGEWTRGLTFSLPEENGKHIEFLTQNMDVLQKEAALMALMKEQRRLAKTIPDPKTPPR